MGLRFAIKDWSAFAPGLSTRDDWLAWSRQPWLPQGDDAPPLAEMPALQRRRLEKLGRMALQVAYGCQSAEDEGLPFVFASRHGDLSRTQAMLQALAQDEALSPTSFGLSTHNAILAQYGIARRLTGNQLAVSSGAASAEGALVEAVGLLAEGAGEVVVVVYDSPLPDVYREFADEPECDYAWAWRIALAGTGEPGFELASSAADLAPSVERELPHGLEVLRFALSNRPELHFVDFGRRWCWRRHD